MRGQGDTASGVGSVLNSSNLTACGTSGSTVFRSPGLQTAKACRKQIRSAESKYRTGPVLLQLSPSGHEQKLGLAGRLQLTEHATVWQIQKVRFIETMILQCQKFFTMFLFDSLKSVVFSTIIFLKIFCHKIGSPFVPNNTHGLPCPSASFLLHFQVKLDADY